MSDHTKILEPAPLLPVGAHVAQLDELQDAFNEARDTTREALRTQKIAEAAVARFRKLQLELAEHEQVAA